MKVCILKVFGLWLFFLESLYLWARVTHLCLWFFTNHPVDPSSLSSSVFHHAYSALFVSCALYTCFCVSKPGSMEFVHGCGRWFADLVDFRSSYSGCIAVCSTWHSMFL